MEDELEEARQQNETAQKLIDDLMSKVTTVEANEYHFKSKVIDLQDECSKAKRKLWEVTNVVRVLASRMQIACDNATPIVEDSTFHG